MNAKLMFTPVKTNNTVPTYRGRTNATVSINEHTLKK